MSWVEKFVRYTDNTTSPEFFRKWAAIWTIGCALERKVWLMTSSPIYTNLYVILTAPPGVGKTEVIWRIRGLLESIKEVHLSPSSVTKASLIDCLDKAERRIVRPKDKNPVVGYNSLQLCINELGVLLPGYDNEFMNTLTDLYDGKGYGETRRTSKIEIDIPNPQLSIIAGTTPSYLNGMLPEGAWDQGFMSRSFVIFSGQREKRSFFGGAGSTVNEDLKKELAKDLRKIYNLYGEMTIDPEAVSLMENWYDQGGPPTPDHPKLIGYNARRGVHLAKLFIIAAVSDTGKKHITVDHFNTALDWLVEAEAYMPEVFKAMSGGGVGKFIEEAWHFLFTTYSRENGTPVQDHRLIQFLQERVPVHQIDTTIQMMERSNLMKKRLTKAGYAWVPQGKQPDE